MIACENGDFETAMVLLDHGAVVDYQNKVTENMSVHNDYNCTRSNITCIRKVTHPCTSQVEGTELK